MYSARRILTSKRPDDIVPIIINIKEADMVQAYCMKCRSKKEIKDAKAITMKNGRPATQGTRPTCGTKMFRIGKS